MKKWTAVLVTAAFSVAAVPAQTVLEEWTFSSEPNGTSFPGLVNSVGSAAWQRVIDDVPQAWAEEGISVSNGVLVSVGNASNVYQRAALTSPGATSGVYEITYDMPLVDFFPSNSQEQIVVRMDNGEGQENSLFQIRLTANDTKYYWNVRNASTGGGANYGDLGTDPLTNLSVRTRFDLQWNEFSSYYSIDGGPEQVIVEYETTNPDAHGKELNFLRFHSTPEKRSADQIAQFDNIRLSYVGPSLSRTVPVDGELVINYQMNDAAGTKLGALRQEGSDPASFSSAADIGGVEADGSGSLLYNNVAAGSKNHTINEISGESITTMEFALSEVDFSGMTDA